LMQSLLVERFKLAAHVEKHTLPVYDLVLSKAGQTGPQLHAHSDDSPCVTPLTERAEGGTAPARPSSGSPSPSIPCKSIGFVSVDRGDRAQIVGNGEPMERIAGILTSPFTGIDRPVRDRTGLSGTFDFALEWSLVRDSAQLPVASDNDGPTFLEALQKQLGLRLTSATGPVDLLVIDHIERPTEN
jgi:uncharacterized protein (TIGR03435 family)